MSDPPWIISVGLDVLGSLASTFLLGVVALLRARVPNLSGVWTVTTTVNSTAWNPYRGMSVTYIVMLSQTGTTIEGVAEKVHEVLSDGGRREYVGVHRLRSEVTGGLVGNIFQKKEFQLIFREQGELRNFVSTHRMSLVAGSDLMRGNFTSTAANSSGAERWFESPRIS